MFIMVGFILLGMGVTIGIGLIQYILGKKNIPQNYGSIIPIVYLISRLSLTAITQKNNWGLSVISAVVISHIYYRIFELAKPKRNDDE